MDKIEVCNLALIRIGNAPIETLKEPNEPARRCLQLYDHDRKMVLRRWPWPWSIKREALALDGEKDIDKGIFQYGYRYPSDCIYLWKLLDENKRELMRGSEWDIQASKVGAVISCDVNPVYAEYTFDVDDLSITDEEFIDALGWKLAASLAFKLTGNSQIQQMATQEYERAFLFAAADARNEPNKTPEYTPEYIMARF